MTSMRDRLHSLVAHLREEELQLVGLRHVRARPLLDIASDAVDEHAVVADEPGVLTGGARDRVEQRRGGALARRARDPEAPHRA